MIILYSKDGLTQKAEIHKFTYNGTFMGESFLTATISSDQPIDFADGDYCMYRGEKFILSYDPAKQKQARRGTYGEAFIYDSIKFNSLADELTRCEFKDVVMYDNEIHGTSVPEFMFEANSVQDLADRIQANLNRLYKGSEAWTVSFSPDLEPKRKSISVSNIKVSEALQLANSEFGANYIIRGRTITIGTAGMAVGKVFGYGKGNGLYDIQQTTNQDAAIITRLSAYGSRRNIPNRYYNKLKDSNGNPYISEALWIPNLMLPSFPYTQSDPSKVYIDSPNIAKYGIREGSVYFDQEDNEIYPSIEGMTAQQLADAGITVSLPSGDNGIINECLGADNPTDDGLIPKEGSGEIDGQFTIYLKDLGFDLTEKDEKGDYKYQIAGQSVQISMRDGACNARTFDVIENGITKDTSLGYTRFKVICNRFTDDSIQGGTAFPNNQFKVVAGDKFVMLGIELPEVYVKAAAQRLLVASQEYLAQNDSTKYTYTPKIDEIFMANHPELGESLKEGDILNFTDTDLDIDASVIIQTLKINEGDKLIPTYEVTLSNDRIAGTIEKMQNAISSLASNQTGITIDQVKSLIQSIGTRYFLSKISDDTASGNMNFLQNVSVVKDLMVKKDIKSEGVITANQFGNETFTSGQFGSGFRAWLAANGQSYAEFDNVMVRREMIINTLTIAEIKSVGGQILLSLANMYCNGVSDGGTYWKCTFDTANGTITNQFAVDDQVICRKFNGANIKYYWAKVTSIGSDYINISKSDKDGVGIPAINDEIIQFGNRTNASRQSAIMLSAYGSDAPSIKQYAGINSYNLTGKEVTVISPSGNKFTGDFVIQSSGTNVTTAIDNAATAASNAQKSANTANDLLTDIASDNKLTPNEKSSVRREWNVIAAEISVNNAQADIFGITTEKTAYTSAFQALANYLNNGTAWSTGVPSWISDANLSVTTTIVGNTFRANWKAYYDARTALLNAIAKKAKQLADAAQSSADTANAGLLSKVAYSEYNAQMQIQNDKIASKVSQTDFNALGSRVSTAESEIIQQAGKIENIVTKVDNMSIGSDNLLTNSAFIGSISPWQSDGSHSIVLDSTEKYEGINSLKCVSTGATTAGGVSNRFFAAPSLEGDITMSFYAKADKAIKLNVRIGSYYNNNNYNITTLNIGTSWQLYTTKTTKANANAIFCWLESAGTIWMAKPMVVNGNTVPTWSQSSKDVELIADNAQTTANNAQNTANLKNRTYYQDAVPTAPSGGHKVGDLWYKTSLVDSSGNINADTTKNIYQLQYRWDGTTWRQINWSVSKSKIEQTDSSISLIVEKTGINSVGAGSSLLSMIEQTPEQIKLEVSKIQIGGVNLVANSKGIKEVGGNPNYPNSEHIIMTDLYADLSAGKTYTFSCKVDGVWGKTQGYDTVEAFAMKDKSTANNDYYSFSTNPSSFTCKTTGRYYIRIDANKGSVKHKFWEFQIEEGNKATAWTPAPEDIDALIAKAQTDATSANNILADIANDNKLDPAEKQSTKKEWDAIVSEYSKNITQANSFSVSTTAYTSAYNALSSYITPLLSNLNTTSDIVGTTFRSNFKAYYDARTDLLNAVSTKAKDIADSKTTINEVKAGITINADGVTAFGNQFKVDSLLIANAIQTNELNVGNGNFKVGTDGKISAKGAALEGSLEIGWDGDTSKPANRITVVDRTSANQKTKVLITPQNITSLDNIGGNTTNPLVVSSGAATSNTITAGMNPLVWTGSTITLPAGKTYDVVIPAIFLSADGSSTGSAKVEMYLDNLTTGEKLLVVSRAVFKERVDMNQPFTLSGLQNGNYRLRIGLAVVGSQFEKSSFSIPANVTYTVRPITDAVEIGANGMCGIFTASRYFHATTDGFFIRMGNYGFRISELNGIQKSTTLNNPTPIWTNL